MGFSDDEVWRGRMITRFLVEAIIENPDVVRRGYMVAQQRLNVLGQDTSHSTIDFNELVETATIGRYGAIAPLDVVASSVSSLGKGKPIDPGTVAAA